MNLQKRAKLKRVPEKKRVPVKKWKKDFKQYHQKIKKIEREKIIAEKKAGESSWAVWQYVVERKGLYHGKKEIGQDNHPYHHRQVSKGWATNSKNHNLRVK